MPAGDIECGPPTKGEPHAFFKVENPGDDTYILAVRVPDSPKVAPPKRSRSRRRRRETATQAVQAVSPEVSREASGGEPEAATEAVQEADREGPREASAMAGPVPAERNQVLPPGNPT
jgi:hypothetical protein